MSNRDKPRKASTRGTTKPTNADSVHDTECIKCEEIISGECIECDACGNWCHARESCCGLNDQMFGLVGDRHIKWVCDRCLDKDTLEKSSVLAKKMDRLFLMISSLENRLERMEKNGPSQENVEEMINKIVDKKLKERLDNMEEKKSIERNVIFCGINENRLTANEAKEDDLRRIQEISAAICPSIKASDISEPIRLGKVNIGQGAKPRPIKVTVKTVKQKWDLIKNARHLKDLKEIYNRDEVQEEAEEEGSENYSTSVIMKNETIYINPDLTKAERMEQKGLRDELKRRKTNGELDIMIKGNQIVKKQPREEAPRENAGGERQDSARGGGQGRPAGNWN